MKLNQQASPLRLTVKPVTAAVAAALGTGYGAGALAQQSIMEEIVVTATRREGSVQDIPINITAIGGQDLRDQRIVGLDEIARVVPGLQIVDRGPRDSEPDVIMRGLNTSGLGPGFTANAVGIYVGEIPLALDLKPNDLERIEVLIGPQGTLYGSGTLGGAVRYIPRKPQNEFEAEIRANGFALGESDGFGTDVGFTINVPLADDTFALRANVDYLDDPGFIDYGFVVREGGVSDPDPDFANSADVAANLRRAEDANTEETLSARFGLRWTPNDSLDATLWYYYQDTQAGGRTIANVEAFGTGKYEAAYRYDEPSDYRNELLSLEIIADLGFAELTSATGISEGEFLGQRDQTDLLLNFEYGYEFFPSFSAFTREHDRDEIFTQELRLVSTGDGPLSWIGGLYYNETEEFGTSEEYTPGFDDWALANFGGVQLRPDELEYFEFNDGTVTESALFGELSYAFADDWEITLGARLYQFEDSQTGGFILPLYYTIFLGYPQDWLDIAAGLEGNSTDDDGSLFKVNLAHNFNDDILGYVTLSEGYRIGGVNPVRSCTPADLNNPGQALCALPNELLIKPDTTTNLEVGVHSTLADGRLVLNGSVYFIDWDNIQVDDTTINGSLPITSNGGGAESKGLELSTRWLIDGNWELAGTYAYNNAELTDSTDALLGDSLTGELLTPSGSRLPGSPEHQGSLSLLYATTLGNGLGLDVRYGVSYMGDIVNSLGAEDVPSVAPYRGEKLPSYTLHNLSAKLSGDQWSATVYIDNLTDEYVVTGTRTSRRMLVPFRNTLPGASGNIDGLQLRTYGQYIGRPRTAGVSFTYLF